MAGSIPAGVKESDAYQTLIEKVQFFNGEFQLLLGGERPPNWLSEDTGKKMVFFEQHLLPYRETESKDVDALRLTLSHRQSAFRFIAEHPFEPYADYEWRTQVSEELSDSDIEECDMVAQAFAYANAHWCDNELSWQQCVEGLRLSLQAKSYIQYYVDEQLLPLRDALRIHSLGEGYELKSILHALLPLLIEDYIPNAYAKKQTLLQFLLIKASTGVDSLAMLSVAEWLVHNGALIDADGCCAFELVVKEGGERVMQSVHWLLDHGANCLVNPSVWSHVHPETMSALFKLPVFHRNEAFMLACVDVFKGNESDLDQIMVCWPNQPALLKKIIETVPHPTPKLWEQLLDHERLISDPVFIKQLMRKLDIRQRKQLAIQLFSRLEVSLNVLELLISKSSWLSVEHFYQLFKRHGHRLQAAHLKALVQALPDYLDEFHPDVHICLLQQIARHQQAGTATLHAIVTHALSLNRRFMQGFWYDFLQVQRWDRLEETTLTAMYTVFSDELVDELFNSPIFLANQHEVIAKCIESAVPGLYGVLLKHRQVELHPGYLLRMLDLLDSEDVQGVLLPIARYRTINGDVLQKIMEVMSEPTDELLSLLLANEQFIKNPALIRQLLESSDLRSQPRKELGIVAPTTASAILAECGLFSKQQPKSDLKSEDLKSKFCP